NVKYQPPYIRRINHNAASQQPMREKLRHFHRDGGTDFAPCPRFTSIFCLRALEFVTQTARNCQLRDNKGIVVETGSWNRVKLREARRALLRKREPGGS